jgi:hypothetical protein
MADLGAFFGNSNLQRQGARARALAEKRDVNTLADPRTYAAVQGLLGTAPDEMGFSVLHPDYQKIRQTAEPAYALGLLGQAAPVLAPLTKGLPVGASIKNVGEELIYHGTSPKAAKAIEKSGFDVTKSADGTIWFTNNPNIGEVAATGKGAVVKRFLDEKKMKLGGWDETDKYSTDELIQKGFDGLKLKDSETGEITYQIFNPEKLSVNKSYSYPQKEALDTAQRNAALPVEEGGLGLPKDNTPEMRAKAMGFDLETYHGTNTPDINSIEINKSRPDVQYMQGFFTSDEPNLASNYGDILMPLLQKKGTTILDKRSARQAGLEVPEMDTIYDKEKNILVTNNPANIRSRFAAFDPMRSKESDILAGVLPLGLLTDEEQRKKLYELVPTLLGQ